MTPFIIYFTIRPSQSYQLTILTTYCSASEGNHTITNYSNKTNYKKANVPFAWAIIAIISAIRCLSLLLQLESSRRFPNRISNASQLRNPNFPCSRATDLYLVEGTDRFASRDVHLASTVVCAAKLYNKILPYCKENVVSFRSVLFKFQQRLL